jgi:glycosyltransferase involved in cell wall biosynthesis
MTENTLHTPQISVIMPVYNRRSFISESVASILQQTLGDFEFIIVDDHSTDGTFEFLQAIPDPRIKLLRNEKNLGISESMNRGIEQAKGEFIARMDSDDVSLPSRFQKQVDFLRSRPEIVCCGTSYEIFGSLKRTVMPSEHDWIAMALLDNAQIANPSAMFRKSIFQNGKLRYKPSYDLAEDYKLWTQVVNQGKLANLSEVLFRYRHHSGQISNAKEIQDELANRVATEYAAELCGGHVDVERFSMLPILSLSSLSIYKNVEKLVIEGLQKRGVKTNKTYFSNRRKRRLQKSILNNPGSAWSGKFGLIVRSGTFLGWRTYWNFLLQSLGLKKR